MTKQMLQNLNDEISRKAAVLAHHGMPTDNIMRDVRAIDIALVIGQDKQETA